MTKREARKHAHGEVYQIVETFITSGSEFRTDNEEDRDKVIAELEKIIQRHFELSCFAGREYPKRKTASAGKDK